ncbi:CopG family antitoxin [uncultured Thiodictyon sp.]|uniref:CopG family antitoxin n=1 Tax=uncultured Thiodictyon sp. TaxID=1846217 RepID=UPI0025FE25D4|nr:CopG family antitoxin [uncultured Thiodictyon sp.]
MKKQQLPSTDSIDELAQFWDAHDLTDFEDQLEVVAAPVFAPKAEAVMKIHLRRQEIAAVTRIARSRGLPRESLLREWVLEKLRE